MRTYIILNYNVIPRLCNYTHIWLIAKIMLKKYILLNLCSKNLVADQTYTKKVLGYSVRHVFAELVKTCKRKIISINTEHLNFSSTLCANRTTKLSFDSITSLLCDITWKSCVGQLLYFQYLPWAGMSWRTLLRFFITYSSGP